MISLLAHISIKKPVQILLLTSIWSWLWVNTYELLVQFNFKMSYLIYDNECWLFMVETIILNNATALCLKIGIFGVAAYCIGTMITAVR